MMLRRRVDLLLATGVAVALLAALPSFAVGRYSPNFPTRMAFNGTNGRDRFPVFATADVRSTTTGWAGVVFRVSTIGPGGLSEPVVATAGRVERGRAERR